MGLNFHLLGDSLDARRAAAYRGHSVLGASDANVPLVASATPGVWGGSMIDLRQKKPLAFLGGKNWTSGTNQFSVLLRIVPTWTGAPAVFQDFFCVAFGNGDFIEGAFLGYNTSDNPYAVAKNKTGTVVLSGDYSGVIPFTQDVPIDLWFISKGGTGVGQFEIWYAIHGQAPTKILNATLLVAALARSLFLGASLSFGSTPGHNSDYYLVEAAIWDDVQDPSAFGARTAAITSTVFDGSVSTDPGQGNVFDGVDYEIDGVAKQGTFAPAVNTIAQSGLFAVPGLSVYKTGVILTQGDDVFVQMKAMADKATPFDLTNATLESYVIGTGGLTTIDDSDHVVDADQTEGGNRGIFTVRVREAVSSVLNVANQKDWVTKITQGSLIRHVHGVDLVTVRSATPLD